MMPTESTFLLAGLLFLAASLGYFFARFGDDEEDEVEVDKPSSAGTLNADYIKGLNFLLNEQPDQALEVFLRMVEVDDETLETHFALGSLFRRRGEVERAIRVHQNIIARPNLSTMHKEHALISLAEDYLGAGLFDRAEKLFKELLESPEYRLRALQKLVRIYEVTHDWQQAIDAYKELAKVDPDLKEVGQIAHYYCELAEHAAQDRDFSKVRELLKKASSHKHGTVRAQLALGDLAKETDDHKQAVKIFLDVMDDEPRLISEIIPRLAESCRALDDQELLSESLNKLRKKDPLASKSIALAAIHDPQIQNSTALHCLWDYIAEDPILVNLVDPETLEESDSEVRLMASERMRKGLATFISSTHRYRCSECGYVTSQLLWQCPSCRSWETVVPVGHLSLTSPIS
ncbi:MAG: lipopolysaccharide assembly protein LapB [Gammaproteobacteria bacterium]|nr:lipopolysaccharide assembly protein LapB [Gammaproteobacteria bacterium]MCP4090875.1 lipopolysaccharide assembly protein LapB [Gammaproteobacteria bacterium]MCP4275517.1 lipopolysaccharide assembly protein LapB [Gammaproteobacteria bacterium]MCP4832239.1 lipopolysaccharide assembly protein LapB [Gammaproteobacteria bacterium]MCP4930293.1 lipopolysaccharide assembly protein LapB [Gammaproteobacteria bacterium]